MTICGWRSDVGSSELLGILTRYGLASVATDKDTRGRPAEVWHAA
jgi:hypothetical protein